nr:MAG TPA: hypothetical protein [Caudoviricetes sp.]
MRPVVFTTGAQKSHAPQRNACEIACYLLRLVVIYCAV